MNAVGGRAGLRIAGLRLPPHGYAAIRYRFTDAAPEMPRPLGGDAIENDGYRIVFDAHGVTEVFDKEIGKAILRNGASGLFFEEDYGSPWETLAKPSFSCSVARHSATSVTLLEREGMRRAILEGEFADRRIQHERSIRKINWRQEISLCGDQKKIHIKTTVDWDSRDGRLMLQFPLSFRTPDDEAIYEIPYGVLARKRYSGRFGAHAQPNGDWPALNFVACRNAEEDYWVVNANKGISCHRVEDGVVKMTLARSPTIPMAAWDAQGAREVGTYSFEAMISSAAGELREANPVRLGMERNAPFLAVPGGSATEDSLPPDRSFLRHDNPSVVVSAVKRAEEGDDLVVRMYEPYGETARATLEGIAVERIAETDSLERDPRRSEGLVFKAHEIKTVRIKERAD